MWIFLILHLCEAYKNMWLAWTQFLNGVSCSSERFIALPALCVFFFCSSDSPKKDFLSLSPALDLQLFTDMILWHFVKFTCFFPLTVFLYTFLHSVQCLSFLMKCALQPLRNDAWHLSYAVTDCKSRSVILTGGQLKYLAAVQPFVLSLIVAAIELQRPTSVLF